MRENLGRYTSTFFCGFNVVFPNIKIVVARGQEGALFLALTPRLFLMGYFLCCSIMKIIMCLYEI